MTRSRNDTDAPCRFIRPKNPLTGERDRVFIPGCMGGAVYGPDGCTCDRSPESAAQLRCADLEEENAALRDEVARLKRKLADARPDETDAGPD